MRVEEEKFRLPVDVRGSKTSVLKFSYNRGQNQNHGSRRIKYFFLILVFTENYFGKSRFTTSKEIPIHEKKKTKQNKTKTELAISHFIFHISHTQKKIRPFTDHENTLYDPLGRIKRKKSRPKHCVL